MRYFLNRIFLCLLVSCTGLVVTARDPQWIIKSPDGKIQATISYTQSKELKYSVQHSGLAMLEQSSLGIVFDKLDFSKGFEVGPVSKVNQLKGDYKMFHGKQSLSSFKANEQTFMLVKASDTLAVTFRVSNDGVAFRYGFKTFYAGSSNVVSEGTSFNFTSDAKGFLQPMSTAKSGWARVNPCYEEHYVMGVPVTEKSSQQNGWVYPALFEVKGKWLLITEAELNDNYCGTHLADASAEGVINIAFPQPEEKMPGKGINPIVKKNSYSPWRVIVVGGLKTIIESNLGNDLVSEPADVASANLYVKPGHSSWSWALLKDDSTVYDVQKKFVSYAAEMGWEYCLVDASWDQMIGYEKITQLAEYANEKGVGLILWYNSAGDWNDTHYTPKNRLLTHESRIKEFALLQKIGVKGVKIDFFGGDGQSFIQYYLDILKDAATYKLLVNFHGATLPRGWHKTYPNLMSAEAVKGFEYVTFDQGNADAAPSHCAMLPFTRNAFDPMDFTPLSLYKVPRIERKTSAAFELGLSVVFLSGIQHFVETPTGMSHMPGFVKEYLKTLPVTWDETKYIDGYPGKFLVLARRSGRQWYVAAINGSKDVRNLVIDLSFAGKKVKGYTIKDGKAPSELIRESIVTGGKAEMTLSPSGGFVMVINMENSL